MSTRAGIDLGGTKIQAVIVDDDNQVLGQARRPTPTEGGPADVAAAMTGAVREAASAASIELSSLAGVGVGSPGSIDADCGDRLAGPATCPAGTAPLRWPRCSRRTSMLRSRSATTWRSRPRRKPSWEPASSTVPSWAWPGERASEAASILDGEQWLGHGDAAEIGHMVIKIGGRRCGCGRRGCMEAYAGRKSMEVHARKLVEKGPQDRSCSRSWRNAGATG